MSYGETAQDILDSCSRLKNLDDINKAPNVNFVHGDICNVHLVNHVMKTNRVVR